jgi:hypothetical protein
MIQFTGRPLNEALLALWRTPSPSPSSSSSSSPLALAERPADNSGDA